MNLYVESSAVLAWLLVQTRGGSVGAHLDAADAVATSQVTLVEVDRALHRYVAAGVMAATDASRIRAELEAAAAGWAIEPVSARVIERARLSFPDDAIRSLDAIHLATAVVVGGSVGDLDVLSLDERIRSNAVALGFRVLPA